MSSDGIERRLAAILSADAVGYSRLMAEDEAATIRSLTAHRRGIEALVGQHQGRVVDAPGDNLLAEFPSALEAVRCAVEIQRALGLRNAALPPERRMEFRIGVHLGDVVVEEGRIYGDGVNIAARLEGLAEPGGICLSAAVHDQIVAKLPLVYDDLGEQSVKNIPRPVRAYRVRTEDRGRRRRASGAPRRLRRVALVAGTLGGIAVLALVASWPRPLGLVLDVAGLAQPPSNPPLPDKPSVVVLPFANLSGDPEQEYFSDGMTEELIADLSVSPGLFVISRNSAFTYKGRSVRVEDVGRDLGVRYVLEGSVRNVEGRVRITAQLVDASNGFHVWSERYDRELSDIFAVQAELAQQIQAALRVEIVDAEFARVRAKPTENLTAYDLHLQGLFHFNQFTREGMARARSLAERSIALDPDFAISYAMLGGTYIADYAWGWDFDPSVLDRAEELARRAIALGPEHAWPYVLLANANVFRGRPGEAVLAAERAIQIDPNREYAHGVLAAALSMEGKPLAALAAIQRALRLNPRHPSPVLAAVGYVNLAAGRTAEAMSAWERVRAANPDLVLARVPLAVQYERAGRHAEAQAVVQEMLRVNPQLTAAATRHWLPASDLLGDDFVEVLRRAGLP